MPNINTRKFYYHLKHRYFTLNNAVIAAAFIIAASWAWGAVEVMQRNYTLTQEIAYKQRQAELTKLENQNLEFQNNYFESDEYQELAVREKLGLAAPGEKVLVLPPNTDWAKSSDDDSAKLAAVVKPSNLAQWLDFLFGGAKERLK